MHSNTLNNKKALTIGQVDFINCLPITIPFKDLTDSSVIKLIDAVPSKINSMILNGELDIAPVSSITYLENKDELGLLGNLCISSDGSCDSVLLFSNTPIENLGGHGIELSIKSATSNKLLQIILERFYNLSNILYAIADPRYQQSEVHSKIKNPKLLIGDDALLERKSTNYKYVYDLGELWKKHTGLPMVFAVWVVRKDIDKEIAISTGSTLNKAKEIGLSTDFAKVLEESQKIAPLSREFYIDYFKHLSFDLNEKCIEGLELFDKFL